MLFCSSQAFLRYLSTINHTLSWWQKDPETRKKSLRAVRKLHAAANKKSMSVHGPKAYMTQFDMVTTQWAFVGPAIILPEKLGFGIPSGIYTFVLVNKKVTLMNSFNFEEHHQVIYLTFIFSANCTILKCRVCSHFFQMRI